MSSESPKRATARFLSLELGRSFNKLNVLTLSQIRKKYKFMISHISSDIKYFERIKRILETGK